MTAGRLHALLLLSWAFWVVSFKRIFGLGPGGLSLFRANFSKELPAVDSAEEANLAAFSRCIACGRCDVGDGSRIAASGGAYPGTMAVMLASSGSLRDLSAASEAFDWISDAELSVKETVCPAAVPMRKIATLRRRRA
jgi:succinate dehydrogenase/fumarate reductase-like Fe-S protein